MDEQLVRALAAIQSSNMDLAASMRALEKAMLALVTLHPRRKELIKLTEYFLQSDAILNRRDPGWKEFLSSYLRHGERLLSEMRDIQENA